MLQAGAFVPAFVHHHLGPLLGGALLAVVFAYGVVIARQEEEARRRRRAGISTADSGLGPESLASSRSSRRSRGGSARAPSACRTSFQLEEMLERQTAILARLEQLMERSAIGQTASERTGSRAELGPALSPVYRAGDSYGLSAADRPLNDRGKRDGADRPNGLTESPRLRPDAHMNGTRSPRTGPDPAGLVPDRARVTWTAAAVNDMKRLPARTAAMVVDGVERRVRTLSPGLTATVLVTVRGHTVYIDAGPEGFQVERIDG